MDQDSLTEMQAHEILMKALATTPHSEVTAGLCADLAMLSDVFHVVVRLLFPEFPADRIDDGCIEVRQGQFVVRIGLISLFEQLDPGDLNHSHLLIVEHIRNMKSAVSDGFRHLAEEVIDGGKRRDKDTDRTSIIPLVKTDRMIEDMLSELAGNTAPAAIAEARRHFVIWRLFDGINAIATQNTRSGFLHLTRKTLANMSLDPAVVPALCVVNLKKAFLTSGIRPDYSGDFVLLDGMDGFAGSLLLHTRFWSRYRRTRYGPAA
jgi:hypothetical protein